MNLGNFCNDTVFFFTGVADDPSCKDPKTESKESRAGKCKRNKGQDSDWSDLNSELSDHAEDEDLLAVQVDPNKTWVTSEDRDLERIERLAHCLRCDPLLPPPLRGKHSSKSFTAVEGLNFPLVHCAFTGCSWVSDILPCNRSSINHKEQITAVRR